jgi:hypothetical protein
MAGKKDEAGRDGQARCLADDHLLQLQSMIDEGVAALAACPLKPGDVLGIERKTRAIGVMARSIKLVDGLRRKPGKSAGDDHEDQDMNHDETGRGDAMDPAQVAALRAELESRLDWIRTVIEKKRMAGRPDAGSAGDAGGADAETA